jgi:hypothetical protein
MSKKDLTEEEIAKAWAEGRVGPWKGSSFIPDEVVPALEAFSLPLLRAKIARLEKEKQEMRLELQRHDCTYGDTPGLIHCSIDKPCTMHQREDRDKSALGWAAQVGKIAAERAELREEIERLRRVCAGTALGGE